jgi:hypothetical protein
MGAFACRSRMQAHIDNWLWGQISNSANYVMARATLVIVWPALLAIIGLQLDVAWPFVGLVIACLWCDRVVESSAQRLQDAITIDRWRYERDWIGE